MSSPDPGGVTDVTDGMAGIHGIAPSTSARVVALGGGHGLAATLRALRQVSDRLTAVVTVADDGGSSGRLRGEFGILPPGDLRMALAALCDDGDWGSTWARVVQHRFGGQGPLAGHAVGNLLIAALWEETTDPVAGLDWLAALLRARGRVLPCCTVPLTVCATVEDPDGSLREERGQVQVATTRGTVRSLRLDPADPPACPEAVTAIGEADLLVLGPGSWFTSVLTHLAIPGIRSALEQARGTRVCVLNRESEAGETAGFEAHTHLASLAAAAPGLRLDVVIADPGDVQSAEALQRAAAAVGARLLLREVAGGPGLHDPGRLAAALAECLPAA